MRLLTRRKVSYWLVQTTLFCVGFAAFTPSNKATAEGFQVVETTIPKIRSALSSGKTTCTEIVGKYLARIEAYNLNGPALNSVLTVNPNALAEASELDAAYSRQGFVGPLHCITVLVKDQVETKDLPTTYGSALFAGFQSGRDATIVEKMRKAGAIIIGKATMGEFASSYVGSAFGFCRNAYDLTRSPGGSSCGTGNGIAANFATIGIAEDTGGSIRLPAWSNNAVGLRPTLPLVSRYGMFPATPSQDTLGPLTRTVRDTAILLDAIAGYDPNDPVTSYTIGNIPKKGYTSFLKKDGLKGMRIGVIRQPLATNTPNTDDVPKVRAVFDKAIADLEALGATVVDPVSIPNLVDLLNRTATTYETEVAVNDYLAQLPNSPIKTFREIALSDVVVPTRRAGLRSNLDKTPSDPAHLAVLAAREELRQVILKLMGDNKLDALVYPTSNYQPPLIPSDLLTNPNSTAGAPGGNTGLAPRLGFPALTVPGGFTTDKLPVGIEFLGRPFAEGTLLKAGFSYEQGTKHRRPPSTTPPLD